MRILLVIPYAPSLERPRSYNFIRRLSQNHAISLVALVESERERQAVQAIADDCEFAQAVPLKKLDFYTNCLKYLLTPVPLRAASCFSPDADALIAQLVKQRDYDVVQVEQVRAAHFGARLNGVATVYDSTDSITLLLEKAYQNARNPLRKLLYLEELVKMRRYEPKISARYDCVLMCSEEDRRALVRLDPNLNVAIVRNGVDLDYFSFQPDGRDPNTIVFTGRLSYYVNADAATYFLDEIFPLVLARKPAARLTIVGPSPPRKLRALASENVVITGYVPDLRPYLAQAAVSVCPVRLAVGTQNKVIEALAMGTPVVATTQGCTGLAVKDGEHLLVADEPERFADKVVQILEDPSLRSHLVENGRAYVESHHDWDVIVGQLVNVYEELV